MLRMTKQADYGIVLLTRMSGQPERIFSTSELADETGLPSPTVSKVLKLLARGRLLNSHRGAKGGYSLSRPPERVTVAQIISALEGPIAITECIDDTPGQCTQEAICPVRGNWQRINLAIRRALEEISLAEMIHPPGRQLVGLGERASMSEAEMSLERGQRQ